MPVGRCSRPAARLWEASGGAAGGGPSIAGRMGSSMRSYSNRMVGAGAADIVSVELRWLAMILAVAAAAGGTWACRRSSATFNSIVAGK